MRRYLIAAGIVAADSALLTFAHPGAVRPALLPLWALVVASVIMLRYRNPAAAFAAALLTAGFAGGASVLLPWTAFQAGREVVRSRSTVFMAAVCAGALAARIVPRPDAAGQILVVYVVFAVLPLLAGRYVGQRDRAVTALARQERLRIARDMHDSLGHRLSLVSVQAAALEVAALPAAQRDAVRRLAASARGAAHELHEVVGALRDTPGLAAIDAILEEFRAAGVPVTSTRRGAVRPVPDEVGRLAYRVVQEGLTNGVKHAPGRPLAVRIEWEPDALLVSVVNPAPAPAPDAGPGPAAPGPTGRGLAGRGLAGLAERAGPLGGLVGHRLAEGEFRLWAILPVGPGSPGGGAGRTSLLGLAVAGLLFGFLPLSLMAGLGR